VLYWINLKLVWVLGSEGTVGDETADELFFFFLALFFVSGHNHLL
jgi:bacteriorhodopsin